MKSKTLDEMKRLNKELSRNSWKVYRQILGRLLSELPYPWANEVLGALRNLNVTKLLDLADFLVSQSYDTSSEHYCSNQIASLIRKYPFPQDLVSYDPRQEAKDKFLAAELTCEQSNLKLCQSRVLENTLGLESAFHSMRNYISYVLGQEPDLLRIREECDFGPGASIGVNGNATNTARKIESNWSVTPGAFALASAFLSHDWNVRCFLLPKGKSPWITSADPAIWHDRFLERCDVIRYNKIAFVPKTTKVHRTIAVEPLLNTYVQKGIDQYMRRKLLRVGIDLSDQSINAEMARKGSLDDTGEGFVTIDLSSASDSISIELCRLLLPPAWFDLLNQVRSKEFKLDGVVKTYHKFCSMGNGFCFPLETLLFAAACAATSGGVAIKDFSVYGDDIIIRKKFADPLIKLLAEMGFQTNRNKTFIQGPFRESCGSDWYLGKDVRPFILDFPLDTLENLFKFLNLTRRSSLTESFFEGVRPLIRGLVPYRLSFCRPRKGNADTGIDCEFDEFMSSLYARFNRDLHTWEWRELHHSSVSDKLEQSLERPYSLMIAALRGASASNPFPVRRKTRTTVALVPRRPTLRKKVEAPK